jgi:hypothetical protein
VGVHKYCTDDKLPNLGIIVSSEIENRGVGRDWRTTGYDPIPLSGPGPFLLSLSSQLGCLHAVVSCIFLRG